MKTDSFIGIKEVKKIVHLGTTSIYGLIKKGEFPRRLKFGAKSLWSLQNLIEWLKERKKPLIRLNKSTELCFFRTPFGT
ncbi:MAG: AlpA family phage regulatory protein [Deltaproteobacteria bacterium]|jgi:predicted DNA-binding transcriptional regulator AlpA|nr:AlpA family phage regulatory protein [Deltaproteobacteria bacterium]